MKFEVAYFRSFVFDDPRRERVEPIYAQYRAGRRADAATEYKAFQDFVFRHVITECGAAASAGAHPQLRRRAATTSACAGVNVLNLEPVLRDPRYRATTFVLIHGGYPFDQQAMLHGVDEERLARLVGDRS